MSQQNKADLMALRAELESLGYNRRTSGAIIAEWLLFVSTSVLALWLLTSFEALWVKALAMTLLVMASMGIATNAHTASHHAISRHRWLNEFFLYFGYPMFHQVAASFWRNKHLVLHHPHPNVAGVDQDCDLKPWFTLDDEAMKTASGLRLWWYRRQGWFIPILLMANYISMVFTSWGFLLQRLADAKQRTVAHWIDLGSLLLHWIVWIILPLMVFEWQDVLMFTAARYAMMSYIMFALFAPAHFPAGAQMVDKESLGKNFLLLQTVTTVNFRTGPIGRLLCGGVEYQIEHHLFPSISPRHYPQMSKHVKAFCEARGYPYRTEGWGKAIVQSLATFWNPKPIHGDLDLALRAAGDDAKVRPQNEAAPQTLSDPA
jgi:linoleoyl-CoA desaturase